MTVKYPHVTAAAARDAFQAHALLSIFPLATLPLAVPDPIQPVAAASMSMEGIHGDP